MAIRANGLWRLILAAPVSLLCACQEGVYVDVTQTGNVVDIAVTPRSSSKTPCVNRIVVYRDGNEATAIWQLTEVEDSPCISRFTFGTVPKGFTPGVPVTAPVPGVTYQVDVSGIGFQGGAKFVTGKGDGKIGHG